MPGGKDTFVGGLVGWSLLDSCPWEGRGLNPAESEKDGLQIRNYKERLKTVKHTKGENIYFAVIEINVGVAPVYRQVGVEMKTPDIKNVFVKA